jgi:hypothetical protein
LPFFARLCCTLLLCDTDHAHSTTPPLRCHYLSDSVTSKFSWASWISDEIKASVAKTLDIIFQIFVIILVKINLVSGNFFLRASLIYIGMYVAPHISVLLEVAQWFLGTIHCYTYFPLIARTANPISWSDHLDLHSFLMWTQFFLTTRTRLSSWPGLPDTPKMTTKYSKWPLCKYTKWQ